MDNNISMGDPPQYPYIGMISTLTTGGGGGDRALLRLCDLTLDVNNDDDARYVGRGASSRVVLAHVRDTGRMVAVKRLDRDRIADPGLVLAEKSLMLPLHHDGIVRLLGTDKDDRALYFILEYCSQGCLAQRIESQPAGFSLDQIRTWSYQLLLGLRYLHRDQHIVHGDIKPGNLLLDHAGNIKIADFGFARRIPDLNSTNDEFGTRICWAPEQVQKFHEHRRDVRLCAKIDIWAFGVTLYQMAFLDHPFRDVDQEHVLDRIQKIPVQYPNGSHPDLIQLIQAALNKSVQERFDVEQLLQLPLFSGLRPETAFNLVNHDDDDDELDQDAQAMFESF